LSYTLYLTIADPFAIHNFSTLKFGKFQLFLTKLKPYGIFYQLLQSLETTNTNTNMAPKNLSYRQDHQLSITYPAPPATVALIVFGVIAISILTVLVLCWGMSGGEQPNPARIKETLQAGKQATKHHDHDAAPKVNYGQYNPSTTNKQHVYDIEKNSKITKPDLMARLKALFGRSKVEPQLSSPSTTSVPSIILVPPEGPDLTAVVSGALSKEYWTTDTTPVAELESETYAGKPPRQPQTVQTSSKNPEEIDSNNGLEDSGYFERADESAKEGTKREELKRKDTYDSDLTIPGAPNSLEEALAQEQAQGSSSEGPKTGNKYEFEG